MRIAHITVSKLATMGAPYNPRTISKHDLMALRRSLCEFGIVEPVVVNRKTNRIVGGHQRVKAAEAEGIDRLPVVYVDVDEVAEKQLNLALNRIAGEWDTDALASLLAELEAAGADLDLTGFDAEEVEEYLDSLTEAVVDGDDAAVPEPPPQPVTRPGDLWQLGKHRLLCGDATDPASINRLLGKRQAVLMATDPPYGVQLDQAWRDKARPGNRTKRGGQILNDDRADWREVYRLVGAAVAYVWHAASYADVVKHGLEESGYQVRQQIIWVKSVHALGRSAYHWKHEPCWYAVREGEKARWRGGRKQMTVWEAASPIMSTSHDADATPHPTQKPILLYATPIQNHTRRGEVVCDPFAGSGTALIACERQERVCVAMELDPRWCDVMVERWEQVAGRKATRRKAA